MHSRPTSLERAFIIGLDNHENIYRAFVLSAVVIRPNVRVLLTPEHFVVNKEISGLALKSDCFLYKIHRLVFLIVE
jgi:hypothetical protein